MNLKDRYKKLTLWNKIAVWGSIASFAGILLTIILSTCNSTENVNSFNISSNNKTNNNNIDTQNNYFIQDSNNTPKNNPDFEFSGEKNNAISKNQVDGVTSNKINYNQTDAQKNNSNQVISINQQGGITANEVNIYEKEPELPIEESLKTLLNKINPEIINQLRSGNIVRVFITQGNQIKLKDLEDRFIEAKLIELVDEGSTMIGFGVGPEGSVYDLSQTQSTYSNLYSIRRMSNFDNIK